MLPSCGNQVIDEEDIEKKRSILKQEKEERDNEYLAELERRFTSKERPPDIEQHFMRMEDVDVGVGAEWFEVDGTELFSGRVGYTEFGRDTTGKFGVQAEYETYKIKFLGAHPPTPKPIELDSYVCYTTDLGDITYIVSKRVEHLASESSLLGNYVVTKHDPWDDVY